MKTHYPKLGGFTSGPETARVLIQGEADRDAGKFTCGHCGTSYMAATSAINCADYCKKHPGPIEMIEPRTWPLPPAGEPFEDADQTVAKWRTDGADHSGGGKLTGDHYYRVRVADPISPELEAYSAECADIIEALGMTFNEGEAFKAIWRLAAARQGRVKPSSAGARYDADKVAHYGARVAAHSPLLAKP